MIISPAVLKGWQVIFDNHSLSEKCFSDKCYAFCRGGIVNMRLKKIILIVLVILGTIYISPLLILISVSFLPIVIGAVAYLIPYFIVKIYTKKKGITLRGWYHLLFFFFSALVSHISLTFVTAKNFYSRHFIPAVVTYIVSAILYLVLERGAKKAEADYIEEEKIKNKNSRMLTVALTSIIVFLFCELVQMTPGELTLM